MVQHLERSCHDTAGYADEPAGFAEVLPGSESDCISSCSDFIPGSEQTCRQTGPATMVQKRPNMQLQGKGDAESPRGLPRICQSATWS